MDYEYEDEPLEGRILWGRIAVYGAAFVLVFLLGSCFGGRGAPSDGELEELTTRVRDLASENAVLEQQLEAASAGGGSQTTPSAPDPPDAGDGEPADGGDSGDEPAEGDEPADGDGEAAQGSSETRVYTVQSGDNLYRIAQSQYGDGSKWPLIADENGLDSSNPLTVGQELRIPPDG